MVANGERPPITHGTTILAFKFADGVLVAGDRRATTGNVVMYDRADKVIEIDRHSVMAERVVINPVFVNNPGVLADRRILIVQGPI